MTTTAHLEGREGSLFRSFGDGFHQCWYPIAISADLKSGELFGTEFCDGRIVAYRGEDGVARAMTPFCKHMGADLGVGDVVGNDVRCAFHHWQYGENGRCTVIPSGDRIPEAASLYSFPVEEKHGFVWVFLGSEPSYAVPSFPEEVTSRRMHWRSFEVPLDDIMTVEPWIFTTNLFDFVHFRVVHGMEGFDPEIEMHGELMKWTAELPRPEGTMTITAECWGTNSAMSYGTHDETPIAHIAATTSMGSQGLRVFMALGAELQGDDEAAFAQAEASLDAQQAVHTSLVNEDIPIMNSLRLGDDHLVAADRKLAHFLRYVRDYPRLSVASLGG